MLREFYNLSPKVQSYLNERYSRYGISGEEGFNHHLNDDAKNLSSDELIELLQQKDISHIHPQSSHPEWSEDINNTYLEDSSINRSRGARESTEEEIEAALEDQNYDVELIQSQDSSWDQFTDNLEAWDNSLVEEVLGGSLMFGTLLTGIETSKAIKNGEITLNEAPIYYSLNAGGRTIRYAIIGLSVTSSSPIIVSAGVGYIMFRNQNLISKMYRAVFKFANDERTRKIASNILSTSSKGLAIIGEGTYDAFASDTSKKIAVSAIKGANIALSETGRASYKAGRFLAVRTMKFVSNERTKNAANTAVSGVGNLALTGAGATLNGMKSTAKWLRDNMKPNK